MISFREFWPLYLRAHWRRTTRAAHYAGVVFGAGMAALAGLLGEYWLIAVGIGGAFMVTVGSHWVFERNRPLLMLNPLWSAVADLRMFYLAATSQLGGHLARHGVIDSIDPGASTSLMSSRRRDRCLHNRAASQSGH